MFLFGFPKNDRANVSARELLALKMIAEDLLKASDAQIDEAIVEGSLVDLGAY